MSNQTVRFLLALCWIGLAGVPIARAQSTDDDPPTEQPTPTGGSNFPNRFSGRQIVATIGSGVDRPEYRLLDSGLLFYREGTEGPFKQLGQQPKEKTKQIFATLEQDCKIKTTKLETIGQPDRTLTWKKVKTDYTVSWEDGSSKLPANYQQFFEGFLQLFPKSYQK